MASGNSYRHRFVPLALLFCGVLLSAPSRAVAQAPVPSPAPAPAAVSLPLVVGRPAPELGLDKWHAAKKKPSRVIGKILDSNGARDLKGLEELDSLLGGKSARTLADHHGKVVLVHVIDWGDPESGIDVLRAVRELITANADRGVQAIGIMEPGERSAQRAVDSNVDWPVALGSLRGGQCQYVPTDEPAGRIVCLIGRSGELVWRGNPITGRRAFLAAAKSAIERLGAARLTREFADGIEPALVDYYAGRLAKAASVARGKRSAAERAGDGRGRMDAHYLLDKIRETELTWLRAMREASKRRREFGAFLAHVDAIVTAFPRTSGKAAREQEKQLAKEGKNLQRLKDERQWRALQPKRPVLFPLHKNRPNDRFAKAIDKYLGRTRHADDAVQRARDLRDRYRAASR
ncbi:MAG: hypothetical protein NXI31_20700 [bacterium]|nr:hypothetical protein [bacterium]